MAKKTVEKIDWDSAELNEVVMAFREKYPGRFGINGQTMKKVLKGDLIVFDISRTQYTLVPADKMQKVQNVIRVVRQLNAVTKAKKKRLPFDSKQVIGDILDVLKIKE